MPNLCQFIFHRNGGSQSSIADLSSKQKEMNKLIRITDQQETTDGKTTSQQVSELTGKCFVEKTNVPTKERATERTNRRMDGQANKHAKRTVR